MFIPFLLDQVTALLDQLSDGSELVTPESVVPCERDGAQPELGVLPSLFHVDMQRLSTFATEEEKTVLAGSQYRWHILIVCERTEEINSDAVDVPARACEKL